MHGRGWVRDQRLAEAVKLRIASLQCELTEKASCAVGMFKMAQLGQQLRWHKFRLELLEDCQAGLSVGPVARHVRPSSSGFAAQNASFPDERRPVVISSRA